MPSRETLRGLGILCAIIASASGFPAAAQSPAIYQNHEGPQLLSPDQLENLVAPVALYPDQLLSQVLAASTYPLELVQAQQWLQRNGGLQGPQLIAGARQQNWDSSVQAMVIFPEAMSLLTRDVSWTTALGNAFLAQQADVMNAIQSLRARAQSNGRLASTPQEVVSTQVQDGQSAIQIQPVNPQVVYVPMYNPQTIWGSPAYGAYAPVGYQSDISGGYPGGGYPGGGYSGYEGQSGYQGVGSGGSDVLGQIFGTAVNLASYFTGFGGLTSGASLIGGGLGWVLNWFTHSLLFNGSLFGGGSNGGGYGGGYYGGGYGVRSAWVHDPGHRLGVPYSNRMVAGRFGGSFRPASYGFGSVHGFGSSGGLGSRESFGSGVANLRAAGSGSWRTIGTNRGSGQREFGGQSFASAGRSQEFGGTRGLSSSFNGAAGNGWHSSPQNRSFGGSNYASNFGSSSFGAGGNRGFALSGYGSQGYRSSTNFGAYASGSRGNANGFSQSVNNGFRGNSSSWNSNGNYSARSSFASPDRSFSRGGQSFSARYSEPRSNQHFSAPKVSNQHFSTPHFSAPKSSGSHFSSGGHGGGGHSGGHSSGGKSSGGHSHKH